MLISGKNITKSVLATSIALGFALSAAFAKAPPTKPQAAKIPSKAPAQAKVQSKKTQPAKSQPAQARTPAKAPAAPMKFAAKASVPQGVPSKPPAKATSSKATVVQQELQWAQEAPMWARTVKASDRTGITVDEASALAIDAQYLVVPSEFASTVRISAGFVRFFVDQPLQEAQVIDMDLAAGFALLKVERPLGATFTRGKLRIESPQAGESLFTLNNARQMKAGSRYIQPRRDGDFISYKIAHGGTGVSWSGFHFDRSGRLVGATMSAPGTETSWASSAASLYSMLRNHDQPRPASQGAINDQRRQQLTTWQDRWTQTLVAPRQPVASSGPQECRTRLVHLSSTAIASQVSQVTSVACESVTELSLGAGYAAGFTTNRGLAVLLPGKFGAKTEADLAQAIASEQFSELEKGAHLVNLLTVPECRTENAVNARGQSVHVRFCTSALKNEDAINDTVVSVTRSLAGAQVAFATARLRGFSQANTKRVIASLMDKVGDENSGGER